MIIDTHQHLLYPKKFNYLWASDFPALQGDFSIDNYWSQVDSRVSGSLFMEVDVPEEEQGEEARFFCGLSEKPENKILGVIASARPEKDGFAEYLDSIAHPALKGIRRVLHTLPGELPLNETFISNMHLLAERGLTFDLCVLPGQYAQLLPLLKACPDTSFIVDHCGVPAIASGELGDWKKGLSELAQFQNVYCKVSGIVAYCAEGTVNAETLRPWFNEAVALFGHDRIVFGGDWPVCNLTSTLGDWLNIATELVCEFAEEQKAAFWAANAKSFYNV